MEEENKETPEVGKYQNENMEIAVHEVGEDNTKYGEFISTYFAWIPLPDQKENAERMAQITKGDKAEPAPNVPKGQNRTGTECPKEEK